MAADLDDVVFELKSISEELAWHKEGSAAKMILDELVKIKSNLLDIEYEIKQLKR